MYKYITKSTEFKLISVLFLLFNYSISLSVSAMLILSILYLIGNDEMSDINEIIAIVTR